MSVTTQALPHNRLSQNREIFFCIKASSSSRHDTLYGHGYGSSMKPRRRLEYCDTVLDQWATQGTTGTTP